MKKGIFVLFLVVCFFYVSVTPGYGMNTKGLLKKVIDAQGGKKKLAGIKNSVTKGNIVLVAQGGMTGTMVTKTKAPNKTHSEFEVMGMKIVQAFDGEKAWMDNPMAGGVQEVTGVDYKSFKRNAIGLRALLQPEEYGIKYAFKGKEKIEDQDHYVLEVTHKDGFTALSFYDPKTYLIKKTKAKVETSQGTFDNEVYYSDFKVIDGITSPHKVVIFRDGQEFLQMTISEVTYNTDISDDEFKMKQQ